MAADTSGKVDHVELTDRNLWDPESCGIAD